MSWNAKGKIYPRYSELDFSRDKIDCSIFEVQPTEHRIALQGFNAFIKAAVADFFNWTSLSVNIVNDNLTAWERLRRVPTCQVWEATGTRKRKAISSSRKAKLSNRTQSRRKMPKPGIRTTNSETEWSLLERNTEMISWKTLSGRKEINNTYPQMSQWPTTRILGISFRVVDPRCDWRWSG